MWPLEILGYASIYKANGEIGHLVEQKGFSANRPLPVQIRFMKKIFALFLVMGSLARAETVVVGQLIDDPGFDFNSFGNQYNAYVGGVTRGANLAGTSSVIWNTIVMSHVNGANGISWTGNQTSAVSPTAALGSYNYTGYSGLAGTSAAADDLTNTGIHALPTITISSTVGARYVIDLLFSNAWAARTFDVSVGGLLYLDDLVLDLSANRRPLVYRFEYVATGSSIPISFSPGSAAGVANVDPYVNAVTVTQVPEPSSGVLMLVGMAALLRRRNRK